MKKITSFTCFQTSEGLRVASTHSEISENGNIISQNNKLNVVVLDTETEVLAAIETINAFCTTKLPE